MSNTRITINDLPELDRDVADSDYLPLDDGTATYKVSVQNYEATAASAARASAEAAAASAEEAKGYKNTAQQAVSDVGTQVTAAQNYASAASGSATSAYNYADAASGSATTAAGHATSAGTSASQAGGYATTAGQKATEASADADRARSWADYPNSTASGSATNNAHYWADQAQAAAGGGVMSFNGRSGYVLPVAHDYNAAKIDYSNLSSHLDAYDVQAAIDAVNVKTNVNAGQISLAFDYIANKESKPTEYLSILEPGDTTITITNSIITSSAKIDVYTDTFGINPTNMSVSGTTLTITFKPQAEAFSAKVVIRG